MNDAEKVREALSYGPEGYPAQNKEPVYIWSDADAALDSILTELAEAKERADHWQHQFHVMGRTARKAEERAEKAEARATWLRKWLDDAAGLMEETNGALHNTDAGRFEIVAILERAIAKLRRALAEDEA